MPPRLESLGKDAYMFSTHLLRVLNAGQVNPIALINKRNLISALGKRHFKQPENSSGQPKEHKNEVPSFA